MIELHPERVCLYFSGFLTLIDKYIVNAAEMLSVSSEESVPFICWLGGADCPSAQSHLQQPKGCTGSGAAHKQGTAATWC